MVRKLLILLVILLPWYYSLPGQSNLSSSQYQTLFNKAYQQYPNIPKGVLEAISYTNTHIRHVEPDKEMPSCIGLPKFYGVMGLVENGKGYFRNNLKTISNISGYPVKDIKNKPEINILAFAKTLSKFIPSKNAPLPKDFKSQLLPAIIAVSELPFDPKNITNDFALNSHLYSVLSFLNRAENQENFKLPKYQLNLEQVFGKENYQVLSASKLTINGNKINSQSGFTYSNSNFMMAACYEYPGVIWDAADPSNYSSRSGTPITHVTIHTMQGSYASAISWFKNPAANVSAHYNMRASDGQITQMVCEIDKAWHVGNSNPYAIGIEHEGYIDDASWYTEIVYKTSADLVKDICTDNSINRLRTYDGPGTDGLLELSDGCYKVKGHQHFPSQTHVDPGKYWDWDYYYELINGPFSITSFTSCSGSFQDPGGAGNYSNDERGYYLIQPAGASSVTISFSSFNLETGYDYLYVYDGTSDDAPLLATLNGTSLPSDITANSGSMFLKFYSDCGTTASGWDINWSCSTSSPTCGIPTNLSETNLSALTCTLNWGAVSGVNYYEVYVKPNNSSASWSSFTTSTNSIDVTGLTEDALHIWKVRAICSSDTSSFVADSFITPEIGSSYYSSNCSGNLIDAGGLHGNYTNSENYTYTIEPSGASSVTLTFTSFELEASYDFLYIYDGNSTADPLIGTYTGTTSPGTVVSSSGAITIKFTSDGWTTKPGWSGSWSCTQVGGAPSTSIDTLNDWYNTSFTASFTDTDSSFTGIETSFYQVLEYNSGSYQGNVGNGFLNDPFSSLSNWTSQTGTWVLGSARQTDESLGNTNLYTALTQGANTYLYHWKMKISGSGTNRRAGIHFFCDDPTLPNRGNSYFVYYRVDQDKVQIYDVNSDSWTLQTDDNSTIDPDVWYDCKVTYNSSTGEIKVYQDDVLVSEWIDPTPLTSGSHLSLRVGNADVSYDFMNAYKSRSSSELIAVGSGVNNDIRVQNPSPSIPAGKINSIVIDSLDQWSEKDTAMVNIDWTAPASISVVLDGNSTNSDLDTFYTPNSMASLWESSEDTNSGIKNYYYMLGTAPNDSSILGATSVSDTTMNKTGLSLTIGQTYYVTVFAENNAGLLSSLAASDGALLLSKPLELNQSYQFEVSCAGNDIQIEAILDHESIKTVTLSKSSDDKNYHIIGQLKENMSNKWTYTDHINANEETAYYKIKPVTSGNQVLTIPEQKVSCPVNSLVTAYPVPFSSTLHFNVPKDKASHYTIIIYDVVGKKVLEKSFKDTSKAYFNTSNLQPGVYEYHVLFNDTSQQGKIVKY